jgi:hypothetical protein
VGEKRMRKKYLIMMYEGPIDGWRTVNYSDLMSASVYDNDDGIYELEDAKQIYELVANYIENEPLIMVEILEDNGIEAEYK